MRKESRATTEFFNDALASSAVVGKTLDQSSRVGAFYPIITRINDTVATPEVEIYYLEPMSNENTEC